MSEESKVTVELPEEVPSDETQKALVDFQQGALEEEIRQLKQRVADLEAELAAQEEEESVPADDPIV